MPDEKKPIAKKLSGDSSVKTPQPAAEQKPVEKKPASEYTGRMQPLVDELGVDGLDDPIFGGRGRIFSAAGRESPVAEFTQDFLVLHPPQKPFQDENQPSEDITLRSNKKGILLNELGVEKTIAGARYRGRQIYYLFEQAQGTLNHLAGWIDDKGIAQVLTSQGRPVTTAQAYKLRNSSADGEIYQLLEPVDEAEAEKEDMTVTDDETTE